MNIYKPTKIDQEVTILTIDEDEHVAVDSEDVSLLEQYTWCLDENGYAVSHSGLGRAGKNNIIYMHRLLMNPGPGQQVRRKNKLKNDNRKSNLYVV